MNGQISILTVDDHPLIREGIAAVINDQPDMQVIAEAATGSAAVEQFRLRSPDIVLLDLRLPDTSGIQVILALKKLSGSVRVIVLTTFDGDVEIRRALEAGARGYMLKSMPPAELFIAIRQVYAGKTHVPGRIAGSLAEHLGEEALTKREVEVLQQLASGNRTRNVAEKLFISDETVKAHVKSIMQKLGAVDRAQAVGIGVRRGIIQL